MKKYYARIVEANDRGYESSLSHFIRNPESKYFNGRADNTLLVEPNYHIGTMHAASVLYCCPESRHYRDKSLLPNIKLACEYIISRAHEDGTTDFRATNFFTPATFELHSVVRAYKVFEKYCGDGAAEKETLGWIKKLLEKLALGCLNGGFHTPNHRWVESAAMLGCYNILGWPELKEKVNKYLAEGIDIDEDGEFTERSPGMYNAVNDNALLMMAEEGNMPELYPHVKKNMDLLFNYIEPDGTIFTQNSRRKDKGEGSASGKFYPAHSYYHIYLWAGYLFNDKRYLKFAEQIMEDTLYSGRGTPGPLWLYMLMPELKEFEPDLSDTEVSTTYSAFYPGSDIYRRRNGFWSYSIIANNPNFMFFKCGDIQMYLRICASFFAVAQFMPNKLEKTDTGYKMFFHSHGEYKMPFEHPTTSIWTEMDHSKRGVIHSCDLDFTVEFTDLNDGVKLHITTSGTDGVPFKLEYVISPNCRVETADTVTEATAGSQITVKHGQIRLEQPAGEEIYIDGTFASHLYHTSMRGSVPQAKDCFTIYSTDDSPIDRTVEIHFKKRESVHEL
ncbi:MAG TPA: hypothetical protein PK629_00325 [Oscillospiraceae bacterium]|nr:hypothetical protein [Oscillospiraceae bacterium]HPF56063.1 hypothetical protein [Clostridiales bacterium]HPK36141.1 hypothetical protein [Oscillospiraceae bacterium]HPR76712.1 hypothetical protein [Oscillospiraceae bacterium]